MEKIQLVDSANTRELVDRAAAGDERSFAALMERYLPDVRRAVHRRMRPGLRPRLDASDIVQETQRVAFQRLSAFQQRRPMPFRLWLLRTAHERLVDIEREHLHAARRSVDREVPLPDRSSVELARQFMTTLTGPESDAMRKELAATIRRCLAQLSETDREILMLRCFEGLNNQEVAAMLELQPETTKKRFTRALLRMQQAMRRAGISEMEP